MTLLRRFFQFRHAGHRKLGSSAEVMRIKDSLNVAKRMTGYSGNLGDRGACDE